MISLEALADVAGVALISAFVFLVVILPLYLKLNGHDNDVEAVAPAILCPWCPGWNPRDLVNRGHSHAMCATCRAKIHAQLDLQP